MNSPNLFAASTHFYKEMTFDQFDLLTAQSSARFRLCGPRAGPLVADGLASHVCIRLVV